MEKVKKLEIKVLQFSFITKSHSFNLPPLQTQTVHLQLESCESIAAPPSVKRAA